jgi:hypothetical protein
MMNIYKWPGRDQIGTVEGNNIYKWPGRDQIGTVEGNNIYKWPSHNQIGTVEGNNIYKWPGRDQIGTVDGGTSVQKGAAGMFLLGYFNQKTYQKQPPSNGGGGSSGEKEGCLSRIITAILGAIVGLVMYSWPGRIGVAYGLAFGILGTIMQHGGAGMGIFVSIILMLICGPLGLLGGFISSKLSRHGNFGALIGAAVTGIFMIVIAVISKQALPSILLFILFGTVPGLVVGAIIGAIVGLVKKQIDKKK